MGRIENKMKHRRPVSETAAPSRGQRKRALKKASLLRKKGLVELTQRVSRDHETVGGARGGNVPDVHKKAGGVDTLSSGSVEGRAALRLPDHPTHHRIISNKSKRTLVATELGQLNDVLATPSFQQDPFTAVQAHLRQTGRHTLSSFDHPSRDQAKSSRSLKTTSSAKRYARLLKQSGSGTREDKKQREKRQDEGEAMKRYRQKIFQSPDDDMTYQDR